MQTTNKNEKSTVSVQQLSSELINFITKVAPWLAPIPSAALVYRASQQHFQFSPLISIILALVIETLGLTSINNALSLWDFNQSRRKNDKPAPLFIAVMMIVFYLISTIGLTYFLEVYSGLSKIGVIFLPFLGIMGGINIALHSDLERRRQNILLEKVERKVKRLEYCQTGRKSDNREYVKYDDRNLSNNAIFNIDSDKLQAGRQAKLDIRLNRMLDIFKDDPMLSITEAAQIVGVSRQTIYSYLENLTELGKIRKNGHGVEILNR